MGAPRHSGVRGEAWHRCDRCGQEFPWSQLVLQQTLAGTLYLCRTNGCYDNVDVMRRISYISMVLSGPEDELETYKQAQAALDEIYF